MLLLRGSYTQDPLRFDDDVEQGVFLRAVQRAAELRQQELDALARAIRNEIAQLLPRGKKK